MAVTEADAKMNEIYSQMRKAGESEMPLTEHASVNPSLRPEQGDGFRIAPRLPRLIFMIACLAGLEALRGHTAEDPC